DEHQQDNADSPALQPGRRLTHTRPQASGSRPASGRRRPGRRRSRGERVKSDIHPTYVVTTVTCTCGNTFQTRNTEESGAIHADVCSNCHPFYTGKQKILDTGGRVARFEQRYAKTAGAGKKAAKGK